MSHHKCLVARILFSLLTVLTVLSFPFYAYAQGVPYHDIVLSNASGNTRPVPSAVVTVCAASNTSIPCSVPLANTLFKDYALTQPLTNPFNADINGNFQFFIANGNYTVTTTGIGYTGFSYQLNVGGGGGSTNNQTLQNNGVALPGRPFFNLISGTGALVTCVDNPGLTRSDCTFVGSIPAGPSGSVQINNNGVPGGASGVTTPDGNALIIKGPDPHVDVVSYGARAVSSPPSSTASCFGTTLISLTSGPSTFQNGDGITVYGCGPTNTLSTPAAPTVTPGISSTFTVPDAKLISATGSSTYNYKIFAIDQHGGTTAVSPVTTITNGATSLGMSGAISVTSASLSGTTLTLTLPATNALAAGMLIHFTKSTNAILSGNYIISSVAGSGVTIIINNTTIQSTSANITSTGGQISWAIGNQLTWTPVANAWEYGICAERPGDSSYSLIGLSFPSGASGYTSSKTFTDWGSTITTTPVLPPYLTNASCIAVVSTNDYLTTTIVSGGGTTSLTVANSASQTASGKTAIFDDAPGFLAAARAASQSITGVTGGVVLIPAAANLNFYWIESRLDLTSLGFGLSVNQQGIIEIGETISSRAHWYGTEAAQSGNQFQAASTPQNVCIGGWPCFYDPFEVPFIDHLTFNVSGNQALAMLFEGNTGPQQGGHISRINCNTGTGSDYSGMCLVVRPGPYNFNIDDSSFTAGPSTSSAFIDTTWTPSVYLSNDASVSPFSVIDWHFRDIQTSARTVYASNYCGTGQEDEFTHFYSQGSLLPLLTIQNICVSNVGIFLRLSEFTNDTSPTASLVILGSISSFVSASNMHTPSAETGGIPPWYTGQAILNSGTFINTPIPSAGLYFNTCSFNLSVGFICTTPISSSGFSAGTNPPTTVCGTATGVLCLGEASIGCTPTATQDCIRADSVSHELLATINGSPELPLVQTTGTSVDLTGQTAAIAATNIVASAPRNGIYRICFSSNITTAGSVSSTLGGTNGFQVIYTSPTDLSSNTTIPNAAWSSTANTTATAVGGCVSVYALASTAIQYSFGYTANAAASMAYEIHVRAEDGLN